MTQSASYRRPSVLALSVFATLFFWASNAAAQANGQLQIHQIRVGQGDAALIVSPMGQTMLIDSGPESASSCASSTGIITYLASIGLTHLDYHVASHYDADHIGCTDFVNNRWPIQVAAYDRGTASAPSTLEYGEYAASVAAKRQTVFVGQQIVLDAASTAPVRFQVVAVNGNGVSYSNENDRGVVLALRFGGFDAVFGGDISSTMEARIGAAVGPVELYKVHHHGSATSSSDGFLAATRPTVAVLSVGSPNAFDHPTVAAVSRIDAAGVYSYWTTPGDGATPNPATTTVANGPVVFHMTPGASSFTVTAGGSVRQHLLKEASCTFTVSPLSAQLGAAGGVFNVSVTTQSFCSWSASSSVAWVAVPGGQRTGSGTVTVTVAPNSTRPALAALVTIAGQTVSVSQDGRSALVNDFDGDGRSDPTVFRPDSGVWYSLFASGTGRGLHWGDVSDTLVPGDYDGDGRSDVAVYRPSTGHWFLLRSSANNASWDTIQWGSTSDIPVPADYDGDGRTDLATYRPSQGRWSILTSSSGFGAGMGFLWGAGDDRPLAADYDGDGRADLCVYRPSTGHWFVLLSSTNYQQWLTQQWGSTGDVPVASDYDGDGRTDIAVYRPSNGTWYFLTSSSGFSSGAGYVWGAAGDIPVGGDFDGDGISDIAVYRPSTAHWFVLKSSASFTAWDTYQWGQTGDVPIGGFR